MASIETRITTLLPKFLKNGADHKRAVFWNKAFSGAKSSATSAKDDELYGEDNRIRPMENSKEVQLAEKRSVTAPKESQIEAKNIIEKIYGVVSSPSSLIWRSTPPPVQNDIVIVHKPSRAEIAQRTKHLVEELLTAKNGPDLDLNRTTEKVARLRDHLMDYPASRTIAVQNPRFIPFLKRCQALVPPNRSNVFHQCLVLSGHTEALKGSGIRVLSIDGGGTRGLIGLEVLEALEKASGGKKISEMFDLIVGVSTGAIIAALVGARGMSIEEARNNYLRDSQKLFSYYRTTSDGMLESLRHIGSRLMNLEYNSRLWVDILKERMGSEFRLIDSAGAKVPKIAIVSSIVNTSQLCPFIFRNYEHPCHSDSHYRGSTKHTFWQAIQASTAAPTYFNEVKIDEFIHQDGGVLLNNPAAIAVHEARQLWPREEFQCIVSVGNGQTLPEVEPKPREIGDKTGWMKYYHYIAENYYAMIESATETNAVHHCISDLLSTQNVYFRLNPYMSMPYGLDAKDAEQHAEMRRDAQSYVRRNKTKIEAAAKQLNSNSKWTGTNLWKWTKRAAEDLRQRNPTDLWRKRDAQHALASSAL